MKNFKKILLGLVLGIAVTSVPMQASGLGDIDFEGIGEVLEAAGEAVEFATDVAGKVISGGISAAKKVGGKAIDLGKSLWHKVF